MCIRDSFWAGVALPAVVGDALDRAQKALDAGGAMVYSRRKGYLRCLAQVEAAQTAIRPAIEA